MIDGKTHREILDLFDIYRTRHPEQINLHRFCLFAGLCTYNASEEVKAKNRMRVDALLKHHLEARGLERRATQAHRHEVIYYRPKAESPSPPPPEIKTWHDPSQATWTPADGEARRRQELRRRAEYQAAREREMAEERASVRGMR